MPLTSPAGFCPRCQALWSRARAHVWTLVNGHLPKEISPAFPRQEALISQPALPSPHLPLGLFVLFSQKKKKKKRSLCMSCNRNSQFPGGPYILHSLQLINTIVSCKTIPGYLSSQRLFLGKTKASQLSLESTSLATSIQYLYLEQQVPLARMNKACALPAPGCSAGLEHGRDALRQSRNKCGIRAAPPRLCPSPT